MTEENYGKIKHGNDVWDIVEVTPYGVQVYMEESSKDSQYDVGDETVFTRNMYEFNNIENREGEKFTNLPQFIDHIMDERRS